MNACPMSCGKAGTPFYKVNLEKEDQLIIVQSQISGRDLCQDLMHVVQIRTSQHTNAGLLLICIAAQFVRERILGWALVYPT